MVSCRNSHSKNKPSSFWPILTISDYREIKTENCKNQTAVELLPIWCQVAHFKIAALREGRNRAISEQNTAQAGTFGMNTCTTDAGRPLKMVKDFKKAPSRVFIIAMLPPEVYVWQFCWFQIRAFSDFWPSPTRCLFALPSFCLLRWPVDCRVGGGNHPRHRLVVAEHPPTDLTSKSTVPHDVPRVFNHSNLVFMEFVSKMPSVEIHGNPCQSQAIWSHLQRDCYGTTTQVHKWNKRSFRNCSCNKTPINNQCIWLFFSTCVWQRSSWFQKQ